MRYAITILILMMSGYVQAQVNNIKFNAGIAYTDGVPTFRPGSTGSRFAVDTVTFKVYENINPSTGNWIEVGDGIQEISGCSAPVYTPTKHQSIYVTNRCTGAPELYKWNGSSWDLISGGGGGGGSIVTDGTLSGAGTSGSPLKLAQQSALTSQSLSWTGTTWEPSWGNPYTFVTTGATITTDVNEVLIGTVSADITIGLPSCNSTNDSKHFKFVRNGADSFSVTIDPSSTQLFYDGAATKIFFGKISIDCTCRFSSGTGVWFIDNL